MTKQQNPTFEYKHPDELFFDPTNPRFGGELGARTQDQIRDYIFGKPHYASELVDSLLQNGFIDYEPLVARRLEKGYVVIEGNRRLSAVKHILANEASYDGKIDDLKSLPVLIFPDKPTAEQEAEMRVYLGVRHLFGFRQWPPRSKAKFLDEKITSKQTAISVVRELGVTKQEIRRLLVPYRLMKSSGLQLPPDEDFWVLGEALARSGVKNFLQLEVDPESLKIKNVEKENLKQLLSDLYGDLVPGKKMIRDATSAKVSDTRDLSRYSKILSSTKARKALHGGASIEQAALYVDTTEESVSRLERLTHDISILLSKVLKEEKAGVQDVQATFKAFEQAVKRFIKNA